LNILLWEIGINIISLKKPWNYIGSTSKLDIELGYKKWLLYFGFLVIGIIARIFF
jgi:hypothetical protein